MSSFYFELIFFNVGCSFDYKKGLFNSNKLDRTTYTCVCVCVFMYVFNSYSFFKKALLRQLEKKLNF